MSAQTHTELIDELEVRPADMRDIRSVARVYISSWNQTYRTLVSDDDLQRHNDRRKVLLQWLEFLGDGARGNHVTVASHQCGVVGFAATCRERSETIPDCGELAAIYLHPSYTRKGIGKLLFAESVRLLKCAQFSQIVVWVAAANPSRRFYSSMGGQVVRTGWHTVGESRFRTIEYMWSDVSALEETLRSPGRLVTRSMRPAEKG